MLTGNFHVALAVLGAALAVGLIGMKASERSDEIPGPPHRSSCNRFWPSPSRKPSCSTPCSSCSDDRIRAASAGRPQLTRVPHERACIDAATGDRWRAR